MEKEIFFKYLELAAANLHYLPNARYNIEAEVARLMKQYSTEEIDQKVAKTTYQPISGKNKKG